MAISGVTISKGGNYALCCVDQFSDDLKQLIRDDLNSICYGKKSVESDDTSYYSYPNTLKEFLERYNKKSQETKIGMLGELLAHLLISHAFPELEIIGLLFNKEERSIRKGFDLNYLSRNKDSIWYGEVKSGEKQNQSVDDKNKALLTHAKNDLKEKLTGQRRSLWDSALNDVAICIANDRVKSVSDLFKQDLAALANIADTKKSALLVSVLFHDADNKISETSVASHAVTIDNESHFAEVMVISIQKSTFSKVEQFLREEATP